MIIKESELNRRRTKKGLEVMRKLSTLLQYMYAGGTIEHSGSKYRMDGDYNLYIVPADTQDGELCDFPLFINDLDTLIEIAESISAKHYDEIKVSLALAKAI